MNKKNRYEERFDKALYFVLGLGVATGILQFNSTGENYHLFMAAGSFIAAVYFQ